MLSVDGLVFVLRKCREERAIVHALRVYAFTQRIGLESHEVLGNELVSLLVDVGNISQVRDIFDVLVLRNETSWNVIIRAHLEKQDWQHAFFLLRRMCEQDCLFPNRHTFVTLLKACTRLKNLELACYMHAEICSKYQLEGDFVLCSCLVEMYAKCGSLKKAKEFFDKLPTRNVVVWTALMAGYVERGDAVEAWLCLEEMQCEGVSPDAITFVSCLQACGTRRCLIKGHKMHMEVVKWGLQEELLIGSALVDMYAKCGSLDTAQEVLDSLAIRNTVSWNALITGYVEDGCVKEALECVKRMQDEYIPPDDVTFICSLKAIADIGDMLKGYIKHDEIVKQGFDGCLSVGNTLIDMYANSGLLGEALVVFDKLQPKTIVSWNALIAGYVNCGCGELALDCFEQLQNEDISSNDVTFMSALKACGLTTSIGKVQLIHVEICRRVLETDLIVGSTLVDTYIKCGLLLKAREVFDKLSVRNAIAWNVLLAGYAELGNSKEALHCLQSMQGAGICPHVPAFACSLKACGIAGAAKQGHEIHSAMVGKGLDRDLYIGNTLVDMYAKCGRLEEAQVVFDKLSVWDEVSCNVLITGYAQVGESEKVFNVFDSMVREGMKPNSVTSLNVLNACAHVGLVDRAHMYFSAVSQGYEIMLALEHHTCMVDLLGRAGCIEKALEIIEKMPIHPTPVVWHTMLGACRKWGKVEFGRHAFEHAICLDEKDVGAFICMFTIYIEANMLDKAYEIEAMRVHNEAWTEEGSDDILWNHAPPFGWG